jgi:serine/threonine protein kinase/Tol biopolymer transport system component
MPRTTGSKLGPYEILAPLGAGGMGEVYRAKDTRLDRAVAIKMLSSQFTADPNAKQRFEREAKAISSLNHPHICVLYDIGHQDGVAFIVMEYLEGETLAKRLEKGPLPVDQALKYGAQIAEALDRAHRSGIVHRDLKPGNIMLTAAGIKLLDFGLAKELAPLASLATLTTLPDSPVTQQGTIVGTFQYMSPEQVEGQDVDGRSDIFSLGSVLYEMLTGKRAFEGKTQMSLASAILERDPEPLSKLRPLTPPALERVVQRCFAKDPEERWQSGRDLASELNWISLSGSQSTAPAIEGSSAAPPQSSTWPAWLLSGALAALLLAGAIWWRASKQLEQTMYFAAPFSFAARDMAISPNGRTIAVVGDREPAKKSMVWLYDVGSREATRLANTEGANFPFWSPDGKSLGFFAEGKLKRLDISGGPVQTLADAPSGRGGTWNRDGVILFTPSGKLGQVLEQIPASGGTPKPIGTLDPVRGETSHRWPIFLPDRRHYLFMGFNVGARTNDNSIYVGSLGSNEKKYLTNVAANAGFAAPDYLLFYRDNTLFAQKLDLEKLELSGEAEPVLTGMQFIPRIGRAVFSVSGKHLLVAQTGTSASLSQLVWYGRNGKELGFVGTAKDDAYANVTLSPDGKSVAVDRTDTGNQNADVWIYVLSGGAERRMTFDPAIDAMPVWSPDGKQFIFSSGRKLGAFELFLKLTDGAQEERMIPTAEGEDKYPNAWSPDGKSILYTFGREFRYLSYPDMESHIFLQGSATLKNGQFSPDGRWVTYASNESGKWEIYVTSFPEARGKWQVSNGGGDQPRWRGDGKELFYLAADGKIMAVAVKEGANFDAGAPMALFQANAREPLATSEQVVYDVTKDGQKFLINTSEKNFDAQPMSIILNWDAALKK